MAVPVSSTWVSALFANGSVPRTTKTDPKTGLATEMICTASSGGGFTVAYDSSLILHDGCQNHTLTLVLKINLNPILPDILPTWLRLPFFDADTPPKMFLIRPWGKPEWTNFTTGFKRECAKWNDRFWLIPPASFSALDVKQGSRSVRPNIYCHLYVSIVGSAAGAHRSINVVNLDLQDAKTRLGVTDANMNSGAFRSDADQYDALDVKTRSQWSQDNTGAWHEAKKYSTVVHEVGHALGLPHIGVSHNDNLCQIAVFLDEHVPNPSALPGLFNGGSNGQACYGTFGVPDRGANVMGGGTNFDETNAAPWASRLALHTGTKPEDWAVSRTKVQPKLL
ncbi:hypothetical protein [Schlesneria paludicola]|uniref:hypothetical protein n=1 Tax=Schlesneria paludicola TaxID=360056 RepID=UPI0012FB72DD|nr:hypothetical protein [Schlesneria paludicola]